MFPQFISEKKIHGNAEVSVPVLIENQGQKVFDVNGIIFRLSKDDHYASSPISRLLDERRKDLQFNSSMRKIELRPTPEWASDEMVCDD